MAGPSTERGHFRPDIEGLRAVAVLAVLLFHAGVPGLRGGFVGVDVFYVISGFLITGLLRREFLANGGIDLLSFYARRARRLLPAALVVIVLTVAASALLLPRLRFVEVAADGAWASAYLANYRFALEGLDYLTDTTISPLLHYWSLGVEEQFYLFWPLVILAAARLAGVRRLALVIAAIGVPSFFLAWALTHVAAPLAFYSLPTRAWELAIGALLAVAPAQLAPRAPRIAYHAAGWAGLALIVAGCVAIDPELGYPGLVALAPTVGTALVIASGAVGGGPARLLSTAVPRWLGRISYSLYLWHWPILILVPLALGVDGLAVRIPLALVAIAVAHASTRWIEQPFRWRGQSRWRPSAAVALAGAASLLIAATAFGISTSFRPAIRPTVTPDEIQAATIDPASVLADPRLNGPIPQEVRDGLAWAARDLPPTRLAACQAPRLSSEPTTCVYGVEDSATTIDLIGDSHAAQWLPALEGLAQERGWRLLTHIKAACPPADVLVWSAELHRPFHECAEWLDRTLVQVAADKPALVIMSARRGYELVEGSGRQDFAERPDAWRDGYARTLAALQQLAPTVLLADTPLNDDSPIDCLATAATFDECATPTDRALDPRWIAIESSAAAESGTRYLSLDTVLCPAQSCAVAFADFLVYRDSGHLTATFARVLASVLGERLDGPQ